MPTTTNELEHHIEKAYHYRGNVTITLKDGTAVEGFIFNREFCNQKLTEDRFVEVFLAGSGGYQKLPLQDIAAVSLTGEDHAAGKSYHDWLAKQTAKS